MGDPVTPLIIKGYKVIMFEAYVWGLLTGAY